MTSDGFAFGPFASFDASLKASPTINDYDPIADIFDVSMAYDFHAATHQLRSACARRVARNGRVRCLDLASGSGVFLAQLAQEFEVQGLGVDLSKRQVEIACERQSRIGGDVTYEVADVRTREAYPMDVDLVTINFDALNHVHGVDLWSFVFRRAHGALRVGGGFLFDVNLPERLLGDWNSPEVIVKDHIAYVQIGRAPVVSGTTVTRRTPMIFFVRNDQGSFDRRDALIEQFAIPTADILDMLQAVGFTDCKVLSLVGSAPEGHIFNKNRAFVWAQK